MEFKELKELIEVVSQSELTTFEIEKDGFKLSLKKEVIMQSAPVAAVPAAGPIVSNVTPQTAAVNVQEVVKEEIKEDENLVKVSSPIVGTFYNASSPGAAPFVKVGDTVKKGQVLCIVEAMKLMNEIEAEVDGTIVEICVQNEQMVEYNTTLFKIRS